MTPNQQKLLDFIREHIGATGNSPTYREMAAAMKLKSKSRIGNNLEVLIEQGYLRRQPNRYRGIELPHAKLAAVPTSALRNELRRRGQEGQP